MTTSGTAAPPADHPDGPHRARPTSKAPGGARRPVRLSDRANLPVVVGVVALVTLAAFETRAFMTILPTVVRELDGWALFGASTGAGLVTFTVAMAWSGASTDRRGPRPVLLWGVVAFVAAQAVSALAPTMVVFVAGRAVSGAAEALIDTSLTVLVAQALPEELRAKVFASFAAAWILPSLLGPSVAAAVDAVAGWRAVFVAPLLVVPVALHLLRPALRGSHAEGEARPDAGDTASERRRVAAALLLAAGLAVTTFSAPLLADPGTRPVGFAAIGAGVLVVLVGAVRALPHGTLRVAPGVPAVVAVRMLVAAAFTAVGGVIPLMLVQTHGASTAVAGVSLSVTGTLWAFGSWLNSTHRAQTRLSAPVRMRLGTALIAAGSVGPVLLALDVVGLVAGMVGWAFAALGMGIVTPTVSTQLLALAAPSERGRITAAGGLAVSTGVALQTGLVGAVVAVGGAGLDGTTFAALMAGGGCLALLASLAAGRTGRPT